VDEEIDQLTHAPVRRWPMLILQPSFDNRMASSESTRLQLCHEPV